MSKSAEPVELTPALCKAARALTGLTQIELADMSGLGRRTIIMFEAEQRTPYARSLDAIRQALERAGCQFIPENGGGEGVRFRKPKAKRRAKK